MLDAIISGFISGLSEREFDPPFMALLRRLEFSDIHFTHGAYEFGKDFIAKRRDDGVAVQYVFQSKAGNLNLSDWTRCRGQIDLLRTSEIVHPNFDGSLPRKAIFVTTGRLVGGAALAAQDYCRQLEESGQATLAIWDRETLIEQMREAISVGLAERADGPLLAAIAAIEGRTVTESQLEALSERWCGHSQQPSPCALEAALVASRLCSSGRLDLASYVALALVRSACCQMHDSDPPNSAWLETADAGRRMFGTYGSILWEATDRSDAATLVRAHREPAALITHAVRSLRLIELFGLLGLLQPYEGYDGPESADVAIWLSQFVHQRSASSPISDRWSVAIIPAVLLMARHGFNERAADYLREVLVWISQRYREGLGLAQSTAQPDEEVCQVFGGVVPQDELTRRPESRLATVLLDLTAFLRLRRLYCFCRSELRRANALPCVVATEDSRDQYKLTGDTVSYESNAPYADVLAGNWTEASIILRRAAAPRYLQRIQRSWDHLAVSSVLRDRHFVSAWPAFSSEQSS